MRLGIDLGTTHTVVALVDRGNYPVVSFEWGEVTPTLVAAGPLGELRFGHDAAQVAREPGWATLRSFKRLLEEAGPSTEVELGGRRFGLADLTTRFLAALREDLFARSNAGLSQGEPLEVAISTPANASTAQRFLTLDCFRRAGFTVRSLLNEPSAAGFEYAHRFRSTLSSKREYVLVYDLGGGTFDASLIHMEGKSNEVITSSGVSRLGGDDFDDAILSLVLHKLRQPTTPEQRALLLDECRSQKESVGPNTKKLVIDLHALGKEPLVLAADEVYEACAPLVEQTIAALEPCLRDPRRRRAVDAEGAGAEGAGAEGAAAEGAEGASIEWGELAGLYVVGGASSFPPVYRLMRERFGQHRVRRSPHPFGSIAIGLAISLDESAGYTLEEKLTRTVGVFREERAGHGTTFDVLIHKDAPLPAQASRRYRAAHNVGHFRFVECARIERGRPEGNVVLWDEVLFPFDPALREVNLAAVDVQRLSGAGPEVEESYRCTAGGALEVRLRILDDGYEREVTVARRS